MVVIDILMLVLMILELFYDNDYVYILSFVYKFVKIPYGKTNRTYVYWIKLD